MVSDKCEENRKWMELSLAGVWLTIIWKRWFWKRASMLQLHAGSQEDLDPQVQYARKIYPGAELVRLV